MKFEFNWPSGFRGEEKFEYRGTGRHMDGCSEVPYDPLPLQIYGVNPRRLAQEAHFNPSTPRYHNPNLNLTSLSTAVWIA